MDYKKLSDTELEISVTRKKMVTVQEEQDIVTKNIVTKKQLLANKAEIETMLDALK